MNANIDSRTIDSQSRDKIVNNIDKNYFVEAGAGSGKTTVLVKRMVSMIKNGVDISNICAITFTKAAANEFYERFQKKLIEESNDPNASQDDKEKYRNALQNIDLAFMGTIDSFCNMIMSEHPNEGEIPSSSAVISDDEANDLYMKEYTDIMNGLYNDPSLEEKAKRFIHYGGDKEAFAQTLKILLSHRDCILDKKRMPIGNIDNEYSEIIQRTRNIVNTVVEKINDPKFKDGYLCVTDAEKRKTLANNFINNQNVFMGKWEGNVNNLLYAYKHTLYRDDKGKGFALHEPNNDFDDLEKQYFEVTGKSSKKFTLIKDGIPACFKAISEAKYDAVVDFVDTAKEEILKRLRAKGKLTFNDYLVYLRDTLKKDALEGGKLINHIYQKHKHFMIDEFQDTDPIQAEIFFYLSAKNIDENNRINSWKNCVPHEGSLFIVGDPKQSIYRFKNADVASYLNVKKMFDDPKIGENLSLYCNFRSTYEIRDWFNRTFDGPFTDNADQADYYEIPIDESEKDTNVFTGVYYYECSSEDDPEEDRVAQMILKLVDKDEFKILKKYIDDQGNERKDYQKLKWSDFMIITKGKDTLKSFSSALKKCGIPYYVEGSIDFNESKALRTLTDIYGAIACPEDNRYLYAALTSRIFSIEDKDLASSGFNLSLYADNSDVNIPGKLKEAMRLLSQLHDASKELSPSSLFAKLLENKTINVLSKDGSFNMEYVLFVLEMIKKKENSNEIISHSDALAYLEDLLEDGNGQERCPGLSRDNNKVHLANLHKVKGLEAPVVFLVHPKSGSSGVNFRIDRSDDDNIGYLFKVSNDIYTNRYDNYPLDEYNQSPKVKEEASAKEEKLRLEYVAATRAKNVLIIAKRPLTTKGKQPDNNPWVDLCDKNGRSIEELLNDKEPFVVDSGALSLGEANENSTLIDNEKLTKKSFEIKRPSKQVENDGYASADFDERSQKNEDETGGDSLATISGTMVHRLMELIVLSNYSIKKDDVVRQIISECMKGEFEEYRNRFIQMLENVYDTMLNGGFVQKGMIEQDILALLKTADEVYPEVPFVYSDGKDVWNGIIDLIYRKDGLLHIVDWKTNKSDENLDEHYKGQLEAYMKAVKEASGEDVVDAMIYHIEIDKKIDIIKVTTRGD